jgi:hypothetical protein
LGSTTWRCWTSSRPTAMASMARRSTTPASACEAQQRRPSPLPAAPK